MSTTQQNIPLNKEQAEYIKELRCSEPVLYLNEVATAFENQYPEFSRAHDIKNSSFSVGLRLCNSAMNILGEQVEDGWN